MTPHDHDADADGLPARAEEDLSREDRDQLKAAFGQRLRTLLDMTGLSSRAFAQAYPAYKDFTIRKYTLGTNLPPWDFLRDLLTEVARRTEDRAGEQRATELFAAYRLVLLRTGAHPHGSDQNSLLLRLFDGETELRRRSEELDGVRTREDQLRADLAELRAARADGSTASATQERRLEEEGEALARRRAELAQRRTELIADMDRSRAHLLLLQETDPAGGDHHQPVVPPVPSLPPTAIPPRPKWRTPLLLGVVLVC